MFYPLLEGDDKLIQVAVEKARASLSQFKTAFDANDQIALTEEQTQGPSFFVKVPMFHRGLFRFGSRVATREQVAKFPKRPVVSVWFTLSSILEDLYFCGSEETIPSLRVKKGDGFLVREQNIEDWLIVQDGLAKGGYTLRIASDRLDDAERHQFEEHTGIREFVEESEA